MRKFKVRTYWKRGKLILGILLPLFQTLDFIYLKKQIFQFLLFCSFGDYRLSGQIENVELWDFNEKKFFFRFMFWCPFSRFFFSIQIGSFTFRKIIAWLWQMRCFLSLRKTLSHKLIEEHSPQINKYSIWRKDKFFNISLISLLLIFELIEFEYLYETC